MLGILENIGMAVRITQDSWENETRFALYATDNMLARSIL